MSASISTKNASISMEFFKKTAQYIGAGTLDYIKEAMPVSTDTISDAKDTIGEVKSSFANINQQIMPTIKELKIQGGFKGISNWFLQKENDIDDSENNYDFNLEFDDGSSISESEITEVQISESERNTNKVSKTILESSHKMVEAQISATANFVTSIDKQTAVISAGFDRTNSILDKILEVLSKNTSALIEVTAASGINKEISSNDQMVLNGKFNLSTYKDMVKKNLGESEISGSAYALMSLLSSPDLIKEFLSPQNLIKEGISAGLNKAAPNIKKNLNALDEVVNDTIMSSLIRLGESNKWGLKSQISKIFGIDTIRKEADTSRSSIELKSVPYDTISKEALTSAIPGYLRKILIALGGDDEIYDYRSRSFKTRSKIKREFDDFSAKRGTLGGASSRVRNNLEYDNFTRMTYDLMMNNLTLKTGKGSQVDDVLNSFKDPRVAKKYIVELFGDNLKAEDVKSINKMANGLSRMDQKALNDIKLQASKQSVLRNINMEKYFKEADNYGLDLSFINDSGESDASSILRNYGREDLSKQRSSSISNRSKSTSKNFFGIDYTNMALYEIYRRLNKGINVYQVGSGIYQKKPFDDWKEKYLKHPSQYNPKTISDTINSRSSIHNGRKVNPYENEENLLNNNELEDGTTENLSRGERLSRWGSTRGRQLIGAFTKGDVEDIKDVVGASISDIAEVSKTQMKKGLSNINDSFGNISGYLKHKMFGKGYSYREDTGEVDKDGNPIYKNATIKENKKGGLLGLFTDELKEDWKKAKDYGKNWFQEVSGYFDYGDSEEDKNIVSKRKKLIATSVGAFAGAGILGGPIGLLVGAIAGNAISSTDIGKKLKEKLLGRDEETGDATGLLTKAFDKISTPIEYQVKKTMNWFSTGLKKHVFGPLSDIGYSIKRRITNKVESTFSKVFAPFKKALSSMVKKMVGGLGKGAGWLWEKGIEAFFGYNRAKNEAKGTVFGAGSTLLSELLLGRDKEGREELRQRRKKRNESINNERSEFESYDSYKKNRNKKIADRRKKVGSYTSEEVVEENTERTADNTAQIADDLRILTNEGTKKGSIYVHDDGVHKYLEDIIEYLTGMKSNRYYKEDSPEDAIPRNSGYKLATVSTSTSNIERVQGEVVGEEASWFDRSIGYDENGNPVSRKEAFNNAKNNIKNSISGIANKGYGKFKNFVQNGYQGRNGYYSLNPEFQNKISSIFGWDKENKDNTDSFAGAALQSITTMGMSNDSISNTETSMFNSIIDESSKDKPSKSRITNTLKKMMGVQQSAKEKNNEEKESIISKILGGLSNAGGLIKTVISHLGSIAMAVGAFYLLFKNGGFKSIAENIHNMFKTDAELEAMGTDASTLGMNAGTAILDSQVENKWDWLNPFKSINHNSKDGAGNFIENTGMTKARNNVYIANGLKTISTGSNVVQGYYDYASNKYLNKYWKYNEKANSTNNPFLKDYYNKKMDSSLNNSELANAKASKSTNFGMLTNTAANIAVIGGTGKIAGWATEGIASRFTSEENAQKIGNATEGLTSTALTVNTITSAAKGKTSIVQKVIDGAGSLLSKLIEKIGASDLLKKGISAANNSKIIKSLTSAKDDVLKAITKTASSGGERLVNAINKKLAEAGLGDILTVTTGGLAIAAGAVVGAISGYCGTEHLFGVLNGDADATMKMVSSIIEGAMRAVEMIPTIGWVVACFDVIDGFVEGVLGCGIKQYIARELYNIIRYVTGLDDTYGATLSEKQSSFSAEKDYYNKTYGANLSDSSFNDMTNNTGLLSRLWSGKAKIDKETGHYSYDEAGNLRKKGGIKNTFVGNDYQYAKDSSGNIIKSPDGKAVVAVDKYGNTLKKDKKLGDYIGGFYKNSMRSLTGGDVYATDENGNVLYDENGNPVVDHRERSFIGKIFHGENPFINEQEKEIISNAGASISGKLKDISPRTMLNKMFSSPISKIFDILNKDENEEYELDEDGKPIEYLTDDSGKPLSENGDKYVKKGDLGLLALSGMRKIIHKLINPLDELTEGMDEYDKKESPWKKDGSKSASNWLKDKIGDFWSGIKSGISALGNIDTSASGNGVEVPAGGVSSETSPKTPNKISHNNEIKSSDSTTSVSTEGGNPLNKEFMITSKFGPRSYPHTGTHKGIDLVPLDGSKEADIGSRFSGTVIDVKSNVPNNDTAKKNNGVWEYKGSNPTGNMVTIETDDGKIIKNMHIKAGTIPSNISVGSKVNVGDKLGEMGSTGWSTGNHLHYQIEEGKGNYIDPTSSLSGATINEFKTTTNETKKSEGDENLGIKTESTKSSSENGTSSVSSTNSSSNIDSTSSSITSGGGGVLGALFEALQTAGNKFLNKITGGLLGSSEDSSNSSTVSNTSVNNSESKNEESTSNTINSSSVPSSNDSTEESVYFTSSPNTAWVAIVRKIKELVAAKKPKYNQGGSMDIDVNGETLSLRPDCTGIISAMLKVYGALPKTSNVNSSSLLKDGGIPDKFDKLKWPGWDGLVEGDIMVRSGHAEIFASNDGNTHYVYNGGSTNALGAAGATKSSKDSYDVIWRCREGISSISDEPSSDIPAIQPENSSNEQAGQSEVKENSTVKKSNSSVSIKDKQGLWDYLTGLGYTEKAVSGIMGCWERETGNRADRLEGDYALNPDVNSVLSSNETLNNYTTNRLFPLYDSPKNNIKYNESQYKGADGNYYPGVGLAQWTGERGYKLMKFAEEKGEDWRNYQPQLDFFKSEMDSRGLNDVINSKDSPSSAAEYFARNYEGNNKDSYISDRKQSAEIIYSSYASKEQNPTDGDVGGVGGDEASFTTKSTIGKTQFVSKPVKIATSKPQSNISSLQLSNHNAVNTAFENISKVLGEGNNKQSNTTVETGELVNMLYQVIKLLEGINDNTGQSSSYLSSISQRGGNNNKVLNNSNPKKQSRNYSSVNSNNNRMITSMARPI